MRRAAGLSLDIASAGLLFLAMAYWAFGNLAHELAGLALFAALVWHNLRKRLWYRTLARGHYDWRRRIGLVLTGVMAATMMVATITGFMISRSIVPFDTLSAYGLVQTHWAAAWWAMVCAGIHLGWHWHRVLNVLRLRHPAWPYALRAGAVALVFQGVRSGGELGLWARLRLQPSLDFWDFTTSTAPYFLHLAAALGLFAVLGHYVGRLPGRARPRRNRVDKPEMPAKPERAPA